jgi:transposase
MHCKSLAAQETRALPGARKLLRSKLHDIGLSVRGARRRHLTTAIRGR